MKNIIPLFCVIASLQAGYAASDDFNRANTVPQTATNSPNLIGSQWTVATGTWAITNNQLVQAAGTLVGNQCIYLNTLQTLDPGAGTNFTVQATVQLNTVTTEGSSAAGILFHYQDGANFYALRYFGNGTVQFYRKYLGGEAAIASGSFTPVQNRLYTLTVSSIAPATFALGIYDTVAATTVYTNAGVGGGVAFPGGYGGLYAGLNTAVMNYDNFSLTVTPAEIPPTVLVQPVACSNYPGCSLTLSPVMGGWQPPKFQWQFNGVNISNATNQNLTLNNLQPSNVGSYALYATNSVGWTNTAAAVVTLTTGSATDDFNRGNTGPQTNTSNPNLIGSHWTIASGTWAITNNALAQAAGATGGNQCIYLNRLQTLDSGTGTNFTVQATVQLNTAYGEGSSAAGLLFNFKDQNNYYAFRYFGSGLVQFYRMLNGGEGATLSVTGFTPIQNRPYRVTASSIAPDTFSVGIYDTVAATTVYTNASVSGGGSLLGGYGGVYAGANTSVMSYDNFSLTVAPAQFQPTVLVQPAASSNYLGCALTLSSSISGWPTPQFQWKFNGVSIPNATSQALTLANLQASNAGSYVLYATNFLGWTNTAAAVVSLSTWSATDDFNRADTGAQTPSSSPNLIGSQWTIAGGTWSIAGSQLAQAGGATSGDQLIYLNTLKTLDSGGTNFTIQATVQLNTPYGDLYTWAGLVFNFQDQNNFYGLRYDGNGLVQLIKNIGGGLSAPLNVGPVFTPVQNRPYTLTVSSIAPDTFSVGIYDTVTATTVYTNASVATGSSLPNGYGGLYASANTGVMTYDNFRLKLSASQTVTFASGATLTKTYGDAVFADTASSSAGLTPVTYSSDSTGVATVDSSGNVTIVGQGTAHILANQAGNDNYSAAAQASQTLTVHKATLTVTGASVTNKVYDGGIAATITGATLSGVVSGDAGLVTLGNATSGTFNDKNVGTGKSVNPAPMTIAGAQAGNYTLTQPTLVGNITTKSLTVTATGPSKTYGTALTTGTSTMDFTAGTTDVGSETVTSVTLTPDAAGLSATTPAGAAYTVMPSLAMGTGGFLESNYQMTYTPYNGTVSQATPSVTVGSSSPTSGYQDSVTFTATLPSYVTSGSVIFLTNTVAFSTNALSSGIAFSPGLTTLPRGTNTITAQYAGDSNVLGSTNDLAGGQIVTNHPPQAVAATYYRTKGISLKIPIANLLTNVTDVDGDTITLQSVGASGIGATITILTNDARIYYEPGTGASSNDNDSFTYTVSDGFGGSATANILVNVYSASGPAQMGLPSNGVVNITFFGIPTYTYLVQTTTNLSTSWWTVSTNAAGSNGSWLFIDPNATNAQQYYRMAQP